MHRTRHEDADAEVDRPPSTRQTLPLRERRGRQVAHGCWPRRRRPPAADLRRQVLSRRRPQRFASGLDDPALLPPPLDRVRPRRPRRDLQGPVSGRRFGSMRRVCQSSLSDRAPTPGSLLKRVRDGLLRDKSFGPHRDRACLLGHARYRLRLPAAVGSVNWLRSNSSKSSHRRDRDGRKRAAVLAAMELTVSRGGMGSNDDPLTDRSARPGRGSCSSRSRPAFPGPAFQRVLGALAPVPSRPAPERHRSPLARSMRIGRLSSASGGQRHRDNL